MHKHIFTQAACRHLFCHSRWHVSQYYNSISLTLWASICHALPTEHLVLDTERQWEIINIVSCTFNTDLGTGLRTTVPLLYCLMVEWRWKKQGGLELLLDQPSLKRRRFIWNFDFTLIIMIWLKIPTIQYSHSGRHEVKAIYCRNYWHFIVQNVNLFIFISSLCLVELLKQTVNFTYFGQSAFYSPN